MSAIIEVYSGKVQGYKESFNGTDGFSFRGIPYAADTSGQNRWKAPQDPTPWTDTFDAKFFGPQCPQFRMGEGGFRGAIADAYGVEMPIEEPPVESEDCLRLNIFSPNVHSDEKRPVMVWIHGGALRYGSGDPYLPNGILKKGHVLVTINYRLGELGFLAHPALNGSDEKLKTNFGLLDQIKALEWVQQNIEKFGGDSSNVTIFGESAGGLSVAALLVSPLSKGLFQKAIVQSGGFARMRFHSEKVSEEGISGATLGVSFGNQCGVSEGPDQLEKMRNLPVDEVIKNGIGFPSSILVDDVSMLSNIIEGFEEGINHKVPTIIGTNSDEGTALYWGSPLVDVPPPVNSKEVFRKIIEEKFEEDAETALAIYPAKDEEQMLDSSKRLLGDSLFGAPSYYAARAMADRGEDIYFYHFNQKPSGKAGEILGAFHASEIAYVFGVGGLGPIENPELSRIMLAYWTNFSKIGNPNGDDIPDWETMKLNKDTWHLLGPKIGQENISRMNIYNLLRRIS